MFLARLMKEAISCVNQVWPGQEGAEIKLTTVIPEFSILKVPNEQVGANLPILLNLKIKDRL